MKDLDFDSLITKIKDATALDEIKKIIPKSMDSQTIIITLAYLASDIAKEASDFTQKRKEILEQIEACFDLWGNC